MIDSGPYLIARGAIPALCVHEAGHAVANAALSRPLKDVEVRITFERWPDGRAIALCGGVCRIIDPLAGGMITEADIAALPFVEDDGRKDFCWRAFRRRVLVLLAGPAAELRYREHTGLPRDNFSHGDARALEWYQRILWVCAGRDGHAFARLIWRDACRFVEDATVWRAIEKIDGALFRGLIWQEPVDPRPGDSIKFGLDGATAEVLIAEAGVIRAELHHECTSECVAPRRPSRGWQEYLATWKKEQEAEKAARLPLQPPSPRRPSHPSAAPRTRHWI
jgi:hypothetical protein